MGSPKTGKWSLRMKKPSLLFRLSCWCYNVCWKHALVMESCWGDNYCKVCDKESRDKYLSRQAKLIEQARR